MKVTAIIPSRYGSKRLEGKPLIPVAGKPMIQRVYEQALKSKAIDRVIVATDDDRIFSAVGDFGGQALMTPSSLRSGTDRVAFAANMLEVAPDDIVVNIQGDQPIFNPVCIDEMLAPFFENGAKLQGIYMTTLACRIVNPREITDPKDVKVVMDNNGYALYFSRSQIPFPRDKEDNTEDIAYYKHLGFYTYTKKFLDTITTLSDGTLEKIEKLEQLRVLEYGYAIKVAITEHDSPEVDLIEDIQRIEALLI
ncbi:3-deoxy-manno-octulosonate cytidylyltransferase [Desulfamplus magnetovallimortis]|uniref:3-deoxy-manno-octulosonate cytidylyltransferase n=1 Tax=Desulfamplus magnetovallimortis TaxID=1246637 RepID=A0A1W1HI92_9BACT|nr:3-deoxy-manno-octulosonate cytidylyltransferase [Desulfamplus magnetovallimortis]SLM32160.1 3-deoxy-manno-octulosonate cytidylyltransferase [Desulfamplus magnetovallimortis]